MGSTGYRDTQVLDGGNFEFLKKNSNDSGHLGYMNTLNRVHWSEFMVSLDILGIFGKTGPFPV